MQMISARCLFSTSINFFHKTLLTVKFENKRYRYSCDNKRYRYRDVTTHEDLLIFHSQTPENNKGKLLMKMSKELSLGG